MVPGLKAWRGGWPQGPIGLDEPCVVEDVDGGYYKLYDMLYYGIGPLVSNARKADVLILGDSRVEFGFRSETLERLGRSTGLRFFNLDYYAGDEWEMAFETVARHDLRPRIVVINATRFFTKYLSPLAKRTRDKGPWLARYHVAASMAGWYISRHLHRVFPRFNVALIDDPSPHCLIQSLQTNGLAMDTFPDRTYPMTFDTKTPVDFTPEQLQLIRRFKRDMDLRGTYVVVTVVPSPDASRERGRRTARLLGAPFLDPGAGPYSTFDKSHLTRLSAGEFARIFERQFCALPMVKRIALERVSGMRGEGASRGMSGGEAR